MLESGFMAIVRREYFYNHDGSLDREVLRNPNNSIISTKNYHYDLNDGRLRRIISPRETFNFSYDNFGNCTNFNGTTLVFTRGNLMQNYGNTEYAYNSFGMRISKRINNVTT